MELIDTAPVVSVERAEYLRLLGYPRDHVLEGRAAELAAWAEEWYAEHGQPWIYARDAAEMELTGEAVRFEGAAFASPRLLDRMRRAKATGAAFVAVGAGASVDEATQRLWREEKPDEYFFLEMFGSAVVEYLVAAAGMRLCAWAEDLGMAVLPHYSPGYPDWEISDQPRVLELMCARLPFPVRTLDSGTLVPKKTLLAVFGLTRERTGLRLVPDLIPCVNCSLANCQYRRTPAPTFQTNAKALRRWAAERLSLEHSADGAVDARFRYDGSTCNNMGQPLAFEYHVKLGPANERYPIREQHCAPVPGDRGHACMCKFSGGELLTAIERDKPLAGRPLEEVLAWRRPASPAGCYCDAASREHKWGLVLETIYYALSNGKSQ